MVVEPEKVAETPLGMTPWSTTGQGHDREQGEEAASSLDRPASVEECYIAMSAKEIVALTMGLEKMR